MDRESIQEQINLLQSKLDALPEKISALPSEAIDAGATDPFIYIFTIFVLACFVGYYVVWRVTPALHTPLMAVTNAISSIIIVGAILAVGSGGSAFSHGVGFIAIVIASVNIFGGFVVTQRMLGMFKKRGEK
jgi:NAD(P) transhydrogenase subunit alpha